MFCLGELNRTRWIKLAGFSEWRSIDRKRVKVGKDAFTNERKSGKAGWRRPDLAAKSAPSLSLAPAKRRIKAEALGSADALRNRLRIVSHLARRVLDPGNGKTEPVEPSRNKRRPAGSSGTRSGLDSVYLRASSDSTMRLSSFASRAPFSAIPFTKNAGVPVTPAACPAKKSVCTNSW